MSKLGRSLVLIFQLLLWHTLHEHRLVYTFHNGLLVYDYATVALISMQTTETRERPIFIGVKSASIVHNRVTCNWGALTLRSSSYRPFSVRRRLLNYRCDWTVYVFIRTAAGDMAKEAQSSGIYRIRQRLAARSIPDFSVGYILGIRRIFWRAHIPRLVT